jgi:hypothetical protein
MIPAECGHRRHVAGCPPCQARSAQIKRRRHRELAYGRWQPYADVGPAREHVRALRDSGIGCKKIAAAAGISQGAVRRILGLGALEPTTRIRPAIAAALLSVELSPDLRRPAALADGTGTRRRLQSLIAAGHCRITLAERLGMGNDSMNRLLRGTTCVLVTTAAAVSALYDELWLAPPDESTPTARRRAAAARAEGRRSSWPLPGAWDDDLIDDPAAPVPSGWAYRETPKHRDSAAVVEDALFVMWHFGYDRKGAAEHMGVSRHALDKAFARTAAAAAAASAGSEEVTNAA